MFWARFAGAEVTDIYLAEFTKLKDEQISRSAHRDRLFHLTLVLFGGGITIALTKDAHMLGLLLLLPVVAFIAGTSHIACDRRISSIGSYIKSTLTKRIAEREQISVHEVFEWESFIDSDKLRKGRKRTQFMSNIFLYVFSGLGATFWYCYDIYRHRPDHSLDLAEYFVVGADILLMGVMAWQLTRHAYIRRSKERGDRKSGTARLMAAAMYVLAVAVGALAAAATLHFGPQLLAVTAQPLALGLPWPVTGADCAAAAAFVLGAGAVLLAKR